MNRSEYMAIKPGFLSKYRRRYDAALNLPDIQAGMSERILKMAQEDIDDQYPQVLRIDGDTANINLYGPMSEDGPDWIDLYLGYGGTAYKNLNRACEEILSSDKVKTVNVYSNTPGGNIDGLDIAMQMFATLCEKFDITVYNQGMIASAGVWYTAPAAKIIASTPSATIGSIGIVMEWLDFTGFYTDLGIEEITITNTDSPNKRPDVSTEKGKNVYKKQLDDLYNVFISRVTDGRPIGAKAIKDLKGEMIIAADAVKIGLMDGIEGMTETSETAGSESTEAAKTNEKELNMDEDVKKAFDALNENVNKLVTALTPKQIPEASEGKTELSKDDKNFCLNIIQGSSYPKTVTGEAAKVLAGESEIGTLKAMTAAVDAVTEKPETDAEAETPETVPKGEIPAGGKPKADDGTIDDEKSAKAELDRVKGE